MYNEGAGPFTDGTAWDRFNEREKKHMFKFVTFNLRCDYQQDGENCFVYRQPLILKAIGEEKPDLICFQEVLPHMAVWLKENLRDYYVIGCGRGEKLDGEQMTVAFRYDRYSLMEMRTLWLSETPAKPGSRYPDQSSCPRTCTDALLMETETGKVLRVLNTHLDHVGAEARRRGLKQILEHLEKAELFPQAPVILAGDFNAPPESPEMDVIFSRPDFRDVTEGIGVTYHGYMRAEDPKLIDYIFIRGPLTCLKVTKWEQTERGVYLSDHFPVCAELQWAEK